MNTYEIINPSDKATFYAENDKIAITVAIIVGGGFYGVQDVNEPDREIGGLYGFMKDGKTYLDEDLGTEFNDFMFSHKAMIIRALRTIMLMGAGERRTYDEAIKRMSACDALDYAMTIKEVHRSSMNDLAGKAWKYADDWEKMSKSPSKPGDDKQ
jgi:hypothetical protein